MKTITTGCLGIARILTSQSALVITGLRPGRLSCDPQLQADGFATKAATGFGMSPDTT
jgi:hypothetical protein